MLGFSWLELTYPKTKSEFNSHSWCECEYLFLVNNNL
jgi:hypothetical protein